MKYTAFGSNMDPLRMQNRGVTFVNRQPVTIPGWELRFNKRMRTDPRFGAANIAPRDGGLVEAILYTIPEADILKLDVFEGFPEHYTRETVSVLDHTSHPIETVAYIAHPDHVHPEDLPPHPDYLQFLLNGARGHLSEGYVAYLAAFRPISEQ